MVQQAMDQGSDSNPVEPTARAAVRKAAYRRRNVIERVVGRYKDYRGLATRYEKLAVNYLALWLVAIMDQALKRLLPNRS